MTRERPLVEIRDLARTFDVSKPWIARVAAREPRRLVKAVDGVSLSINKGETFALVGESGSGKSTIARMVVGLIPPTRGEVLFDGVDIGNPANRAQVRRLRRRFQMIFQDPYASLNPRWRVDRIIAEPIRAFGLAADRHHIEHQVAELLRTVKLDPADGHKFPHEFSGGQRQRIAIARAMILAPKLVVLDEPTSALDRSVQKEIVDLLRDLQGRHALAYVFISHDLAVVRALSDAILVMKDGKVVESGPVEAIFERPQELYTQELMAAAFLGRQPIGADEAVPSQASLA